MRPFAPPMDDECEEIEKGQPTSSSEWTEGSISSLADMLISSGCLQTCFAGAAALSSLQFETEQLVNLGQ
jgi:hypothetical protein